LDRYSDKPSYKIGLFLQEEIVSVYDDSSLFDNAQGTTNYNSPGADRYKINLLFTTIPYDENLTTNFIQLLGVKDGIEELIDRDDGMFNWMEILARRTYDESGHYTVSPFGLDVREYFFRDVNRGVVDIKSLGFINSLLAKEFVVNNFKDTKLFDSVNDVAFSHTISLQDKTNYPEQNLEINNTIFYPGKSHDDMMDVFDEHLSLGIERGNAYVFGWNIRSRNTKYIPYKKSLDSIQRNNEYINTGLGAYIYISDVSGVPEIGTKVNFYNTPIKSQDCIFEVIKDNYLSSNAETNTLHTNTNDQTDSEWWTSVYNTTNKLEDQTTSNGNTLNVRVVATAWIKGFEHLSGSGSIDHGLAYRSIRPLQTDVESAIFKLFISDIIYNKDTSNNDYTSDSIRSVSSPISVTGTWPFSASTLISYNLVTNGTGSIDMGNKTIAYSVFSPNYKTAGSVYYSDSGHIIIKPLGSTGYSLNDSLNRNMFNVGDYIQSIIYVGSGGDWQSTGGPQSELIGSSSGGRIISKSIIDKSGNGSLIPIENSYIQTIRHVDETTGTISIDTSYKFIRLYSNTSVINGSINLTLGNSSFEKFMAFDSRYYFSYANSSTGVLGVVHKITSSMVTFSNNNRTINISNPQDWTSDNINIYIPIVKTEAIEKQKRKISNVIELPYSLVDNTGEGIDGYSVSTAGGDIPSVITASFGQDIIKLNETTYNTSAGIMYDAVMPIEFRGEYTMKKVQLKHSDICEVDKIYDTGNIDNLVYRVSLDDDTELINSMSVEQLQYASDAFSYFESSGISPWTYNPSATGELSPFYEEMEERYLANGNTVTWPNDSDEPLELHDITDSYDLDDGQRNDIINLGYLNIKRGRDHCIGRMIVVYSFFEHSSGSFAIVDSYINTEHDYIPTFGNQKLSSYFDFRPATIGGKIQNSVLLSNDLTDQNIEYPLNNSDIITDYRIYLPRRDLLYLTKTGFFKVAYGISAVDPVLPETPTDGMVLYELYALPATNSPSDVRKIMIDNRRYTMRDIGKIDKRVSTLEYYTSLSLLEKNTSDMQILDTNGNNRFKNGFLVEPFDGHNIGDVIDPDYQCSIDMRTSELRPRFNEKNVNMTFNPGESEGFVCLDDVVMLPFTNEMVIEQLKCSKSVNVNPYAVFTFRGGVELKPPNDDWRDVITNPDLKIDRDLYSTFAELADITGALGTTFGEIEEESRSSTLVYSNQTKERDTSGAGRGIKTDTLADVHEITHISATQKVNFNTIHETAYQEDLGNRIVSTEFVPFIRSRIVKFSATTMKPNTRLYAFFDGENITEYCSTPSQMTLYDIVDSDGHPGAEEFVNSDTNTGFIKDDPKIYITGNTSNHTVRLVDISWDGVDDEVSFTVIDNLDSKSFILDEETFISMSLIFDQTFRIGKFGKRNGGVVEDSWVDGGTGAITTNNEGSVNGIFNIPNSETLRFRVGDRVFRLTDQINNSSDPGTSCETEYTARGILEHQEKTIINVRAASFQSKDMGTRDASYDMAPQSLGRKMIATTGWYDPLAQTIMVMPEHGFFISRIGLYFATKPEAGSLQIKVRVQIRNTLAGFPGQIVMAEAQLHPRDVNVSADGTAESLFTFKYPFHLQSSVEYCIVILADTQDYRCYVSRMSEESLDGQGKISEQPHSGVFFKSQNASTWTADQMEDLKFRVYRAKFEINNKSIITYNSTAVDENDYDNSSVNLGLFSMRITKDSPKVIITVPNHDLYDKLSYNNRYYVAITGLYPNTLYGGTDNNSAISGADINGVHEVEETSLDTFTIDVSRGKMNYYASTDTSVSDSVKYQLVAGTSNTPSTSGLFTPIKNNNYDLPRVYVNSKVDMLYPSIQRVILDETDVSFFFKSTTGSSQHSRTQPGIRDPGWSPFVPDSGAIEFTTPRNIFSFVNESLFGGEPSLQYKALLQSNTDYLTPMIDNQRISASCISNRLNYPTYDIDANGDQIPSNKGEDGYIANDGWVSELEFNGGSADCKYITKEIALTNPATSLRIALSVHIPFGSDINLYYKLKHTDSDKYRELKYTLIDNPDGYYNIISKESNDYTELSMDLGLTTPLPEFTSFGIKIVMIGINTCDVPKVKDLRVIATA
jgi:hypothetical protein